MAAAYQKASRYPYYNKIRKLLAARETFNVVVLRRDLTHDQANVLEGYFIAKFRSMKGIKLYNLLNGGAHEQSTKTVSLETKQKTSASKMGKPLSAAHRKALCVPHKPARITEEHWEDIDEYWQKVKEKKPHE